MKLGDALKRLEAEVKRAPAAPAGPTVTLTPVRDADHRILHVIEESSDGTRLKRMPVRDADMRITSVVIEPLPPKPA